MILSPCRHFGLKSTASFIALMMVAASTAVAQTPANDDETTEVVITAVGYGVKKSSLLNAVDSVTQDEIALSPSLSLGDHLSGVVGVRSSNHTPGASRPIIRGLDGFRVLVLSNGLVQSDVSALSADHATASDAYEAKKIEIVRGPAALMYGGNAIGGVVNVVDDLIPQGQLEGMKGRLTLAAQSVDQGLFRGVDLKTGTGAWSGGLIAYQKTSEDYDTPVGSESLYLTQAEGEEPDLGKKQENVFVDTRFAGLGVGYVGEGLRFGVSLKRLESDYGVPGHAHHDEEEHDEEEHAEEAHAEEGVSIDLEQTRLEGRFEKDFAQGFYSTLKIQAAKTDYRHAEIEDGALGTVFDLASDEARISVLRENKGNLSHQLGVSIQNRDFIAVGDEAYLPPLSATQKAIFTGARYLLPQAPMGLGFEGGARFESSDIKTNDFNKSFNGIALTLGAFISPNDHSFIGLSLSHTERAPSESELLADGPHVATGQYLVGDRALKMEVGQSADLSVHFDIDTHNKTSLDAHLYDSRFDHFIDLIDTGEEEDGMPVYKYINTSAHIYGLEIKLKRHFGTVFGYDFKGDIGYDLVRGSSDFGPLGRIAPSAFNINLKAATQSQQVWLRSQVVADRKSRLAANELPTNGFHRLDIGLSQKITKAPELLLVVEVRNLLNEEIRQATSFTKDLVVAPARSVHIKVQMSF